jgi:hypothetical protein
MDKKDDKLRMCIDCRALNKIMINNNYFLLHIDDMLDILNGAKYFSQIDLKLGYYQIRITNEDVKKTTMKTKYGSCEFLMMPFGLCNAPLTFTTLMNSIFHENWTNSKSSILMISRCIPRWQKNMQSNWNMFWASYVRTYFLPIMKSEFA